MQVEIKKAILEARLEMSLAAGIKKHTIERLCELLELAGKMLEDWNLDPGLPKKVEAAYREGHQRGCNDTLGVRHGDPAGWDDTDEAWANSDAKEDLEPDPIGDLGNFQITYTSEMPPIEFDALELHVDGSIFVTQVPPDPTPKGATTHPDNHPGLATRLHGNGRYPGCQLLLHGLSPGLR